MNVKVADFGIVKQMEGDFAMTGVGTVAYMSPERLKLVEGVGYGFPADVWAVGLIAGECACGVHLYPEEVQSVQWDYMAYVMDEPTPNLDRERFSPEIRDFVEQCLRKEQRHRPSAHHLLQHPFVTSTETTRLTVRFSASPAFPLCFGTSCCAYLMCTGGSRSTLWMRCFKGEADRGGGSQLP